MEKRQAAGEDSRIDYSDIPALTDQQLAQFRRTPKVLVAARIDREVYDWLLHYGQGYSTRINRIFVPLWRNLCSSTPRLQEALQLADAET